MLRTVVILCAFSAANAQNQNYRPAPDQPDNAGLNLPSQTIGPDDLISLSVYDSPEFSRTIRVGPDGMIRLPLLKQKIKAAGYLPGALEGEVAKALVTEKLLVDPLVTVTITEYHSRPISVVGAVRNPLTFQAVGRVTLIDALTRAGGVTDDAEGELLVSVRGTEGKTALPRRIPVRGLIDNADPELNLILTGGEEIRVPNAPHITVAGNVKKPGSYPVKENSEMSVIKAIALAEGTTPFWANTAYIYRPDNGSGKKTEIEIPLAAIMKRKAEDIPLMARDILYVPDSSGKRGLERALRLAGATASGIAIFH